MALTKTHNRMIAGAVLTPQDFGAVGDGVADDTTALQAMFNAWRDKLQNAELAAIRMVGDYRFTSPLEISFTSVAYVGGCIDMGGGRLLSDLSSSGVAFTLRTRTEVRNLSLYDFSIRGSANDTITVLIDGGDHNPPDNQYLYNVQMFSPKIENAPAIGMKWVGNYFENAIYSPFIICKALTAGTYACWMDQTSSPQGNPSSIDIYGGSMRGGIHALYSDIGDIKIFGGTYLNTGNECILHQNFGGLISGVHVENAFDGNAGSNQAGISLVSSGSIRDIYAVSNNGNMDTAIKIFSGTDIDVSGIELRGGVSKAVNVLAASGRVNLRGIKRADTTIADLATQRLCRFDNNGKQKVVGPVNGALDINMDEQDWYYATIDGNVTINNPTNQVAGDELVITLKQDGTGGHTVTWNALFQPITAINTTANKFSTWRFLWTGGAWVECGASA